MNKQISELKINCLNITSVSFNFYKIYISQVARKMIIYFGNLPSFPGILRKIITPLKRIYLKHRSYNSTESLIIFLLNFVSRKIPRSRSSITKNKIKRPPLKLRLTLNEEIPSAKLVTTIAFPGRR